MTADQRSARTDGADRGLKFRWLGLLPALAVLAYLSLQGDLLTAALHWIDGHRSVAAITFILAYVLATVLLVPGLVLTLAAGALFGLWKGVVLVSTGSVLGATVAFFIGRDIGRSWVAARAARHPKWSALDRALNRKGFAIVLLARLSPVFPFNLLNYACGLSAVRPTDYILASWIGMLPAIVLDVYLGAAGADILVTRALAESPAPTVFWALFMRVFAALIVTLLIARIATRALREQLASEASKKGC